ncbi:MAG: T9SS type A sorting domain-containing protein, partial [Flavobacterium sp.]|uniref:T9SS type A sorting domain-containing protein n=1 Tax=Flavobacterium sp. TaxID=239 RepID=UPI0025C575EB
LGWTEAGTATMWDVEWGTFGFTPTGTPTITNATNTQPISSLSPNTTYSFYVRANCGAGGYSTWSGPFSFTTSCVADNVPYTQNFESATVPALPSCTTQQNVGTGNLWTVQNNGGYGFTTNALRYSWNSSSDANVWFYTNGINLVGGTTYKITYDYGGTGTTFPEKLKVSYGNSANAAAMTTLLADHPNVVNDTPVSNLVNFTPATSGVYYFGFNAYSIADQFYLFVDNIVVDVALSNANFDNSNFIAYPNPVRDILNISYTTEISSLRVINMIGQEVISKNINATSTQVDMSALSAGAYIVNVTVGDSVKTLKVVKQ